MDSINQAKMWYYIALKKKFDKLKDSEIRRLSKDISQITGIIPIEEGGNDYSSYPGQIKNLKLNYSWKILKSNRWYVSELKLRMTNLKLWTLLEMCVDHLSSNDLRRNGRYSYMVAADKLFEKRLI